MICTTPASYKGMHMHLYIHIHALGCVTAGINDQQGALAIADTLGAY